MEFIKVEKEIFPLQILKNQIINKQSLVMFSLLFSRYKRIDSYNNDDCLGFDRFKEGIISNSHEIRGGQSPFKEALSELVTEKARQVINSDFNNILEWECLREPINNWENKQFVYLSTLINVGTCTLKRIFGHKCYENTTLNINTKTKEKLSNFLETDNLDQSVLNFILKKEK